MTSIAFRSSVLLLVTFCCSGVQAQPPAINFKLNAIEQAFLDQMLDNWEKTSSQVNTLSCKFERRQYSPVFGPAPNQPFSIDQGELSYKRPDKGSFRILQTSRWQEPQAQPGQPQQQGGYVEQKGEVGEHWVCDGENIYEYRHEQEQLVVRPIPPDMQGKAIVDGPLPFLFGAEAEKIKKRYMLAVQDNKTEFWLHARPRTQADAANFTHVILVLDRQSLYPSAMRIYQPDNSFDTYIFDTSTRQVNAPFQRLKDFFQMPKKPFGWTKIVEPAAQQAQQPGPQRR